MHSPAVKATDYKIKCTIPVQIRKAKRTVEKAWFKSTHFYPFISNPQQRTNRPLAGSNHKLFRSSQKTKEWFFFRKTYAGN